MFGPTSRGISRFYVDKDAGPGVVSSAGEGDQGGEQKAKGGLHSKGTPDAMSGETGTPSEEDEGEEETDITSPHGKKRTASEDLEVEDPKRGKVSLLAGSEDDAAQFFRKDKPLAES